LDGSRFRSDYTRNSLFVVHSALLHAPLYVEGRPTVPLPR
jgi:hypothetical protein